MAHTQLDQMVDWLDQELRKERSEVAKLRGVVERLIAELSDQGRQVKDLEGRLANTQAQLAQLSNVDETLSQFKSEIVLMLEKQDDQHRQDRRQTDQVRMSERETQARAVNELRKELQRLPRIEEDLRLREAEDRRLGETVMGLRYDVTNMSKDFDERARNLSYISEQRAYDNKRLANLQEESLTLLKRTEGHETSLTTLVDRTQRHERHLQELLQFRDELKRSQEEWAESNRLADEDRKREMREWRGEVDSQRSQASELAERMQHFSETADTASRVFEAIETFKEQLRRDQNQVAELQRLAEERQRKELEEWQAEDEKRGRKHEVQWEHQWKEEYQRHNSVVTRQTALDKQIKSIYDQLAHLWKLQEIENAHRMGEVQRWQTEFQKVVEQREAILRQSED